MKDKTTTKIKVSGFGIKLFVTNIPCLRPINNKFKCTILSTEVGDIGSVKFLEN